MCMWGVEGGGGGAEAVACCGNGGKLTLTLNNRIRRVNI